MNPETSHENPTIGTPEELDQQEKDSALYTVEGRKKKEAELKAAAIAKLTGTNEELEKQEEENRKFYKSK